MQGVIFFLNIWNRIDGEVKKRNIEQWGMCTKQERLCLLSYSIYGRVPWNQANFISIFVMKWNKVRWEGTGLGGIGSGRIGISMCHKEQESVLFHKSFRFLSKNFYVAIVICMPSFNSQVIKINTNESQT